MNSNMLAGERRWGSTRRGGMTVLGKVAVPKPINLPSQRLENHGLNPNVEIVPKGTLSWGSRSSSSASNPWVSSSLSPNADGGTVSPSHLSGRPSSGGSGTRPSTAGSDRTHETAGNAWGSTSRPSSASGTLSSNQTSSTSLRPRSAENRPNSSQLSRFAEPASKSSVAWGLSNTAERLGVKSPKEDGFSLSSGDFPTLGSEKDSSVKNIDTEDHDRPSSASGRIAQIKEDAKSQADLKHGLNTWRADGSRSTEDDIHPCMEKWQGDSRQYFNANPAPQHFDAWHGPPLNGPAGVWYGGRPRAPAFGAPVPPRGFPMEQFPYYRPHMPPPPLAGSQPVPPPGAGPRGPRPKNGDLYRPQVPDAYARPGMPFRPGFYPGPPGPMAFEGYYGPPMGYGNSERDIPYVGMAAGPPVYQGYAPPRPDVSNSHGRSAGRTAGKTLSGQMEAEHLEDTQRPKRAPLKKHNEYESYDDQSEEGENQETNGQHNIYSGKSQLPMISSRKNEWGAEVDAEEAIFSKRATPNENFLLSSEYQIHSVDSTKVKSFEGTGNVKAINDNWTSKSEGIPSFPPDMRPLAKEKDSSVPAVTKNSVLMHKIDGLNAKIRGSDGRNDVPGAYTGDEQRDGTRIPDMKFNNCTGEFSNSVECFERTPVSREFISVSREEVIVPADEKPIQSMGLVSRSNINKKRSSHGGQGRVDHHGKGKLSNQNADGWKRKPNTESSSAVITSNIESAPNFHACGPNIVVEASENSSVETYDSTDGQRAKMRELAKQRALQLQKEEEERTREQKAKALAKLEELDRRQLAGDAANQKADRTQATVDVQMKQEESPVLGESVVADLKFQVPALDQVSNPGVTSLDKDNNANSAGKSVEVSRNIPQEMDQTGLLESNAYPLPGHEDARDSSAKRALSQFNDGGASRHRRPGYRPKQNNTLQKSFNETVSCGPSESNVDQPHVATIDNKCLGPSSEIKTSETNVANASNVVGLPSGHQKRKSNRTSKNKHKVDENPATPALPPVQSDTNPGKDSIGTGESKDSLSNMDSSVSTVIEPDTRVRAKEVCSSLPYEESQGRASNQWKPHPSHRLPRNQLANRSMDKLHGCDTVVWAPVRTHVKAKGSVDASHNSIHESSNSIKGDNMAQNSSKGKRAEMERYVPKPVAKELAQQGSIPSLSSSSSSSRSNEDPGREQSGSAIPQHVTPVVAYFGSGVDINEGDGNHKHKNDHGTWRQQGSTDSSHMKGVHLVATSEPTKDNQQAKEPVKLVKSEISSANAENRTSGRGKRHLPKGTRSTGNNADPKSAVGDEIDGICNQSAAPDVNQMDRGGALKESRSFGERTSSQWQPKSHSNPVNNQHGNRNTGSQSVTAEINRLPRKDNPQHKVKVMLHHDTETGNDTQPQPGQSVNVKRSVAESNVGHLQELEKEKKPAPVKDRPCSPNQDPVGFSDLAPTHNTDDQIEHNILSGSRRNARQNSRSSRVHESRGDWSGGHDTRPQNIPSFQDRQRQNVHYEYQPVGFFKGNKPGKVEEPADRGGENMDQRQRGRGQSHSKRGGNIYRRRTGTVHIDSDRD